MTQTDMIVKYMRDVGSITPLDAMREFGCMRLAARIADLERFGWVIRHEREHNVNRYGKRVQYARYTLEVVA